MNKMYHDGFWNSGNNITEKWLTIESDTTVLYQMQLMVQGIGDANSS